MYELRREDAYDEEVRYDIITSSNKNPLMAYVYPLRISATTPLRDDHDISILGRECELVTPWFSLGLVR